MFDDTIVSLTLGSHTTLEMRRSPPDAIALKLTGELSSSPSTDTSTTSDSSNSNGGDTSKHVGVFLPRRSLLVMSGASRYVVLMKLSLFSFFYFVFFKKKYVFLCSGLMALRVD